MPLAEKDMFGRGGRFYAHAFVLAEEEFARVGCNPFALLDGGLVFATSLAEGKAAAPQWRQGVAPDVELELSPISANAAAPPLLLREFVSYLEKSEYLPVAIPEPTGGVLAFLRALFHWLPPSLRREASFDTLSTGQSLGTLPYRFAGALSIDQYRRWSYRRTHRLELASGKIAPPLTADDSFFGRLLSHWLEAGSPPREQQAEAVYGLLRAFAELRPEACRPDGLDAGQLREALALPGVAECVEKLRVKRIETDLSDEFLRALIQPMLREYLLVENQAEGLRRIADPIPGEQLEAWVYQALTEDRLPRLSPEQAQLLCRWLTECGGDKVRRCRLIAQRWFGEAEKIAAFLASDAAEAEKAWLREWLQRSLETGFPGEGELAQRVRDALDAGDGSPEQLAEAELFLVAAAADDLDCDSVRLLLAFHRGQAGNLLALLQGPRGQELRDFTINRFETADVRCEFRCCFFDCEFHLGVEAAFRGRDARKLAALGVAFYEQQAQKTLRFWLGRAAADLPQLIEGRISAWLDPNGELLQCVKKERWDELSHYRQRLPGFCPNYRRKIRQPARVLQDGRQRFLGRHPAIFARSEEQSPRQ